MSTYARFSRFLRRKVFVSFAILLIGFSSGPAAALDFYWDADATSTGNNLDGTGLGGAGTWDTSLLNWWDLAADVAWPNNNLSNAIFTSAFPTLPYAVPVTTAVNVDAGGVTANRLTFVRGGYTVSGGALTLAGTGAGLQANLGESATIDSQISGTAGLVKTGGGSIRLGNALNDYTGTTTIADGSLIISNPAALGGTGAVSILTTNTTPLNTSLIGFGGGSLVLDGTAGAMTFTRDVNFEGRGPIGDRGSAILSLGSNTLSGILSSAVSPLPLSPTASFRNSRINSVNGTLTLSGTLNAGGTSATTFVSLGGVNSAGIGDFNLTGVLAGTGSIEKSGAGTLFLNPSSTSGFTGTVRVSASSTGQQSSVRVTQLTVGGTSIFGANTAGNASGAIELNGGVLEFRKDGNLDFNALSSGKNVYLRASGTLYTGPAPGGAAINGLTTLGTFRVAANQTQTFNSRNGYGMTLQAWTQESSNATTGIANAMGGTLTFTGDAWNNADGSARNLTFSGNGNTRIIGNITATGTTKQVIKQGTGELILNGIGGTFTGNTSIEGGAVRITDFRSINNVGTASISLGNATTTGGNLIIGGTGVGTATALGLTSAKPIILNTTSGANSIYANQSFAAPVILNGAITKIAAATTGALILGGSSQQDNIISVVIPVETTPSTGGVTKLGSGTWVLNAANTYLGATTIQGGVLKLRATGTASDVIKESATNTVVFNSQGVTGAAGGVLEFRGVATGATTETLGALTPTAGSSTVRLLGQGGFAANLVFNSATAALGATAAATSLNFDTTGANGGTISFTGVAPAAATATTLPGTANFQGHLYLNGSNFADIVAGVVTAPTYGGAGNFRDAGAALVAATHNRLTGATAMAAGTTISSLLTNSQTLTMSGNLVVSTGGILQSGGTASILSNNTTARLIQGGAAGTNVAIRVNGASDVLNLGSATNPVNISSLTTAGLTKNGAGTLVVFGTNAQTGTTTINEGKVSLDGAAARLSATSASLVVRQDATLELLSGVTAANAVVNALDGAGTIIGLSGQTFTQNGGGTWNGVFSGAGLNITKGGAAATWSGVSTYTGVTTIGGTGLVTVDTLADGGVNSGIGASSNAASNLVFTGSTAGIDYRGSIIDNALTLGSRSASTDRLFTLAAAATGAILSSTASNNNAIVWSNTGAIVNNTTANATLTFAGAGSGTGLGLGDNTFNPQLVDSSVGGGVTLGVTKSGAGQWNLGASNNTYTGITTLNDGILGLNNNGALSANSPLLLAPNSATSAAILQMSGTFERNLAATATAGSGTVTFGGTIASTTGGVGFAAHSTPLTVAIGGVGSPTALTWGSGGFVGTAFAQNLVLNSTTALSSVDFKNAIDLGASARTINVLDNGNTGADYATMSGVISGSGGTFLKNGTGILRLTGANSYTGTTAVEAGTLVVSSLGSSTGGAASSVGAGAVAMDNSNAIVLGNATTTGGILQYVGAGETSDRKIRLRGTTAGNQIHADGSGPLILTNVAHDTTETGSKTLSLRGTNTAGNMITSVLSDNGLGVLSIGVDGGATWILTGANTYTGSTTASGGALGIGNNGALGTVGGLVNNNGNVFAYGADRTLANVLTLSNNATNGWFGDYTLTFSNPTNLAAGANNVTTNNSIAAGKTLTMNGITANALTDNRTWTIDGQGETVINGAFTSTTGNGVGITKQGNGTLTLGTNGATSNWNIANNAVDVDRGALKFTANNAIPTTFTAAPAAPTTAGTPIAGTTITVASTTGLQVGQRFSGTNVPVGSVITAITSSTTFTTSLAPTTAIASGASLTFFGSGGLTLSPEVETLDTSTVDLNGTSQTVTGLTATTTGAVVIDNTSGTPATFTFGANNSAVSITNTGARTITDSGAGALSIVKTGNTALTLPTGMTLSYQGSTSSTGGGSFTINSALNGTTGLIATGNSTLALPGGLTTPGTITSIEVGGGSILSLLDGTGSAISNLTSLNLGAGSGTTTLNLNVGDSLAVGDFLNTDTLTLLTGNSATLANTITFNMTDAGLNPLTTYTLLNLADGGLTAFGASNIIQGATPGGFSGFTWTVTNNLVQLTTGNLITGNSYWRGLTGNTWNANANNWSTDKAGTIPAASIPGSGTDVVFAYDGLAAAPLTTTLEQNIKINSLTFEAGTTTPTSVTIAPGAVSTNRLEVAPQVSTDGIRITAGGPAAVTISAPVRLGGTVSSQTWNVADASSVLTLSGGLQGEKDVIKTGSGKVTVSIAADSGFNSTNTTDFTVDGGTLEILTIDALGVVGKRANVAVNTGAAFFYNNAASGTVTNALTLGGGTLSAGGANQTYSGSVNVSSDSIINMRNNNGGTGEVQERNITLSGVLSGSGNLTVSSDLTLTAGNALSGNLTLNNAANTWSGDLFVNQGSVTFGALASPAITANDITFSNFGKVALQGVNATTLTRSGTLNFAAGSIGEFNVDNTSGTLGANYLVDQGGVLTLGSAGTGASVRLFLADAASAITLSGGVTLGGNSSISIAGGDADSFGTISGIISDGGSGYGLTLNDDAGGWAQTNTILLLTGANTYTGGTVLASGTLILGNKDALSTGPLAVTAASTLNSLVDLTGLDARSNALNLSAVLTFTGSNGITFSGTTNNVGAGGITNSLTSGNLLFAQVNLAESAAAAARTLTIAGSSTGSTTINTLVNNDQNNTLTNNLSPSPLSIGSIALSESAVTGRSLTLGGTGNTVVTGLIEDVIGGGGTAGSLIKAGAGTLQLDSANTYNGGTTLSAGRLRFGNKNAIGSGFLTVSGTSTVSAATALTGVNAVTNAVALNASITFDGANSLEFSGGVNLGAAARTITVNGGTGAVLVLSGAITNLATVDGTALTLAGNATGSGTISGGITQTGDAADAVVTGGTWTHQNGTSRIGDLFTVSGASTILKLDSGLFQVRNDFAVTTGAVLNLNGVGALSFNTATLSGDASLRATGGGIINLGASQAVVNTEFDGLRIGTDAAGVGTLNLGTFNQTVNEFILGNRNIDRSGVVSGTTGVLTATGNLDLYGGMISGNLGSSGAGTLDKLSLNTVTLSGDNSALAATGATVITEGTLVLDYTNNTATKVRAASALDMRGATLNLIGNATTPVAQTVGGFTLGTGGANIINTTLAGQDVVLNLGAITRATNSQDGTVRFNLASATPSATLGYTTTSLNTIGTGTDAILGAWATVNDGTGTYFARNLTGLAGGNIGIADTILQNVVESWVTGQNISDSGSTFAGTVTGSNLNSLRFNNAGGSDLLVAQTGVMNLVSGGILVTSNVGGTPSMMGGTLVSSYGGATPEIIVTQDSAASFEIGTDIRSGHILIKSGTGTLLLSGQNTYTGLTEILDGTLALSGGNAIGDSSLVTLSATRDSTLQLLASETIGRLNGGSRNQDQELGTVAIGVHTLTVNQSATQTYAGRITGTGTLVMNSGNTGNLNLSNISAGFTGSVVINGGTLNLTNIGQINASSIAINRTGNLLLDNGGSTRSSTRILDTTPITLNSADGAFSGQTIPRGLAIRTDQNATTSETIGSLNFNSGTSYLSGEANTASGTAISAITADNFTRLNSATLTARGRDLGVAIGNRNQFRIGTTANETAFIGTLVGGAGLAGTQNISIVPWAIGAVNSGTSGALVDGDMGNSFLTYGVGTGLRPLNLTTEYDTIALAAAADNARETMGADLTGLSGKTVNSLVINNTAFVGLDVTGSGAGQALAVTSGAILFTVSGGVASTVYDTTLGGFDNGITVGGTNEYIISVVNPSSAANTSTLTATIASPLTSIADLTKSGRGTLVLNQVNTAGGGANKTTINEGTLQIVDLDNIGGATGGLVFAGGALRLATGFADDLSTRTISFLLGGGRLDTNGNDATLANSLGSGAGAFTKIGAGNLTLNATSARTGATTLTTGTITIGATNALGVGGNLTIGGGTTVALGTNSISADLVTTGGASPQITGSGALTASTGFFLNHTGDTAIGAALAGAGGLLKAQANAVTLSGLNTYTGTTEIQAGTLSINSITNVGGGASALGNASNAETGIIRMGLTTAATTLQYTGAGHTSDRLIGMQGTTAVVTIDADGTGALGLGGARFENAGNKTLTLRGTSDPALVNTIGALQEIGGVLTLTKSDANTWAITGQATYTGNTTVQDGILRFAADKTTTSGTLTLGSATTAGSLELTAGSAAFTTFSVVTNATLLTNNLLVGSGETLTLSGNVTIGANAAASTTLFSATGGGSFVNSNSGGTFQVGGATGATNVNAARADFSGLANFTANLGPVGTFRVGDENTNTAGTPVANSSLILASTANTITAGTLHIGQGAGQGGSVQTLTLGSGTNVINADTINIGGNTTRSGGSINFAGAAGSVIVRAADGTTRAVVNMTNGGISTGLNQINDFLLAGHTADLFVSSLTMAARSASTGFATSTLSFDQGTLDVTTLNMAQRTSTGTGNATATVNLGDSVAPGVPTATIGTLNMAVNTSAGGSVVADLNITGGNVTIGTGSGTAINMANAGTGRTVTSTIDITGGTVSVTGDIVRTGGAGTENATVTLDGGTLDLNGNDLGTSAAVVSLNAQSGTLQNLGELNGGGNLVKTTAGTLVLAGDNNHTGRTVVNAGILSVSSEDNLGNNPLAFNAGQLEIGGGTLLTTASFTIDDANRGVTVGATGGTIETAASTALTVASTSPIVLTGNLTKTGDGALYLNSTTTGSGAVNITDGTFGGTGTISGNTTIGNGAILTGGTDGTVGTINFNGTLTNTTGATWLIDIVGDVSGSSDLINLGTGALDLNNAILSLAVTNFTAGNSYTIATYSSLIGGSTFNGIGQGDIISGYQIDYGTTAITLTAVPEPGTLGLLGMALGGFFFRRLRKRRIAAAVKE